VLPIITDADQVVRQFIERDHTTGCWRWVVLHGHLSHLDLPAQDLK